MVKNYWDLENEVEKIIHILYAGLTLEYYEESKRECFKKFGKKQTLKAVEIINSKYTYLLKK